MGKGWDALSPGAWVHMGHVGDGPHTELVASPAGQGGSATGGPNFSIRASRRKAVREVYHVPPPRKRGPLNLRLPRFSAHLRGALPEPHVYPRGAERYPAQRQSVPAAPSQRPSRIGVALALMAPVLSLARTDERALKMVLPKHSQKVIDDFFADIEPLSPFQLVQPETVTRANLSPPYPVSCGCSASV